MHKKRYLIIVVILTFVGFFWYAFHHATPAAAPIGDTGNPAPAPAMKDDLIEVATPLTGEVVRSPIVVKGKARGSWFFEASAPVSVVNWDGLIIGEGYIKVDEGHDWMTSDYVPFTGSISYDASKVGAYKYGWLILKKDNPTGDSKFDNSLEIKVQF